VINNNLKSDVIKIKTTKYEANRRYVSGGSLALTPFPSKGTNDACIKLDMYSRKRSYPSSTLWLDTAQALELSAALHFLTLQEYPEGFPESVTKGKFSEYFSLRFDVETNLAGFASGRENLRAEMIKALDEQLDTVYPPEKEEPKGEAIEHQSQEIEP